MQTILTTLKTKAVFSDDGLKRYLLEKTWDERFPSLAIIMLAPSQASGIALDSTTTLVLNNASRLGYGAVSIVNLFATLNDPELTHAVEDDPENLCAIVSAVKDVDLIIYAPGTGKAKSKVFQARQHQVLEALRPFEGKLVCLCREDGKARLQHPLSPAVRQWHLSSLRVDELLTISSTFEAASETQTPKTPKKNLPKVTRKEPLSKQER